MLLAIICLSLIVFTLFAAGFGALIICDSAFVAKKDFLEPEAESLTDPLPSATSVKSAA